MENNLPQQPEQETPQVPEKKGLNKKLLIAIGLVVAAILIAFLLLTFGFKGKTSIKTKIAPLVDNIDNPQHVKVSLGFSVLNLVTKENQPVTVDLNIQTLENEGISGGTLILKYDLNQVKNIRVSPVTGDTGLLPIETEFSSIMYNPSNVTITFKLPDGAKPIKGKGRIAQLTFTPVSFNTSVTTQLLYDLQNSNVYTLKDGIQTKLKPSQATLDVKLSP